MQKNMNDRIPVKGTVSMATAEAILRGEIESNNGLRKSSGRRSWNPEQPEFELDYGPTFDQMVAQALSEAFWCFVFEDLIPACKYLFRTEVVPAVKWKLHEQTNGKYKPSQIIEAESTEAVPTISKRVAVTPSNNIISLADYRKAVNQQ